MKTHLIKLAFFKMNISDWAHLLIHFTYSPKKSQDKISYTMFWFLL